MAKISGEANRNIRLCVDSYELGVAKGHYYHPQLDSGGRAFECLAQFLEGAESLFDSINFPQSYTAKRSFSPKQRPDGRGESGAEERRGKRATFDIRVLFRQHASWQGSVIWVEEHSEECFRSALELIQLIDSALGGIGEEPA